MATSKLPGALHLFYTVLIFVNNFCYGVSLNMIGAAMVDLSFIFDVSLNRIAYVNICILLGYLVGSFGSYTYGFLPRQLVLAVTFLGLALLFAAIPFLGHLYVAFGAIAVGSLGAGTWDSAQSVWLCEIWAAYPAASSALLQALQFMYGVGTFVSPLVIAPFLHGKSNYSASNADHLLTTADRVHSLALPYLATGALTAAVPALLIVMYFVCPFRTSSLPSATSSTEKKKKDIEEDNHHQVTTTTTTSSRTLDPSSIPHRSLKLLLISVAVGTYIAGEGGFISYGSSMYQYLGGVHLSATEAAHVQSVLSATSPLAALLNTLVSLKLPIDLILSYHYVLQLAALAVLFFGHSHGLPLIYGGTALLGFGYSATWPGMFAFTEVHLVLTDRIGALFVALTAVIGVITPLVLGQTFKTAPIMLLYLTAAYSAVSFGLFLVLRFWVRADEQQQKRIRSKDVGFQTSQH